MHWIRCKGIRYITDSAILTFLRWLGKKGVIALGGKSWQEFNLFFYAYFIKINATALTLSRLLEISFLLIGMLETVFSLTYSSANFFFPVVLWLTSVWQPSCQENVILGVEVALSKYSETPIPFCPKNTEKKFKRPIYTETMWNILWLGCTDVINIGRNQMEGLPFLSKSQNVT